MPTRFGKALRRATKAKKRPGHLEGVPDLDHRNADIGARIAKLRGTFLRPLYLPFLKAISSTSKTSMPRGGRSPL